MKSVQPKKVSKTNREMTINMESKGENSINFDKTKLHTHYHCLCLPQHKLTAAKYAKGW